MKWEWENLEYCAAPRDGSIILVWNKDAPHPVAWFTSSATHYLEPEKAGFTHWIKVELPE